jgi:hypothetical protein
MQSAPSTTSENSIIMEQHQIRTQEITNLFGWLVADDWCWFVLREEYCWLVAGG